VSRPLGAASIFINLHCVLTIKFYALDSDGTQLQASSFESFMDQYGRSYEPGTAEYDMRKSLFLQRLAEVETQNSRPFSDRLWIASINSFSDYTEAEMLGLSGYSLGIRRSLAGGHGAAVSASSFLESDEQGHGTRSVETSNASVAELPDEMLWTDLWTSQRSQIRTQRCGNCWAASTASMIEAHVEIHLGIKMRFDADEITECTDNRWGCGGTGGCGGSIPELALLHLQMNWLKRLPGFGNSSSAPTTGCPNPRRPIVPEDERPPHELRAGVRHTPEGSPAHKFGFLAWERLAENMIMPMKRALVARGPLTVAVSADFANYHSGIFDSCTLDARISHSVLLIGYGRDKDIRPDTGGTKFWLIQNSWGENWGIDGKARLLLRDDEEETCGVDKAPEKGNGCVQGPAEVRVCGACGILFDTTILHFETRKSEARARLAMYLGL